tara:strand:+ start:1619 stop:2074 length:456 start_codon:yes stop_codon:yes gene_type:complete
MRETTMKEALTETLPFLPEEIVDRIESIRINGAPRERWWRFVAGVQKRRCIDTLMDLIIVEESDNRYQTYNTDVIPAEVSEAVKALRRCGYRISQSIIDDIVEWMWHYGYIHEYDDGPHVPYQEAAFEDIDLVLRINRFSPDSDEYSDFSE